MIGCRFVRVEEGAICVLHPIVSLPIIMHVWRWYYRRQLQGQVLLLVTKGNLMGRYRRWRALRRWWHPEEP